MSFSPLIQNLFDALRCLPGVGPRTAQRMALQLLERDRQGGRKLVECMSQALEQVGRCSYCRNLTEYDVCTICADDRRDQDVLCVVETPADLVAIEHAGGYRGRYFVLLGRLSPIEGIGPEKLGFEELREAVLNDIAEVIIATSATVEGDATAAWLVDKLQDCGARLSRIAHGIPRGGELDFLDSGTLQQALVNRRGMT